MEEIRRRSYLPVCAIDCKDGIEYYVCLREWRVQWRDVPLDHFLPAWFDLPLGHRQAMLHRDNYDGPPYPLEGEGKAHWSKLMFEVDDARMLEAVLGVPNAAAELDVMDCIAWAGAVNCLETWARVGDWGDGDWREPIRRLNEAALPRRRAPPRSIHYGRTFVDLVEVDVVISLEEKDSIPMLTLLAEHGFPKTARSTASAADGGRLELLQFLHNNGWPWDESTIQNAAEGAFADNDKEACLLYALDEGCPWPHTTYFDKLVNRYRPELVAAEKMRRAAANKLPFAPADAALPANDAVARDGITYEEFPLRQYLEGGDVSGDADAAENADAATTAEDDADDADDEDDRAAAIRAADRIVFQQGDNYYAARRTQLSKRAGNADHLMYACSAINPNNAPPPPEIVDRTRKFADIAHLGVGVGLVDYAQLQRAIADTSARLVRLAPTGERLTAATSVRVADDPDALVGAANRCNAGSGTVVLELQKMRFPGGVPRY